MRAPSGLRMVAMPNCSRYPAACRLKTCPMLLQVVKCYAWELPSLDRITNLRKNELSLILRSFIIMSLNTFLLMATPTLVAALTFICYVALGNQLTATIAFTSITLFGLLRMPLFQLPLLLNSLTQAAVSINRI